MGKGGGVWKMERSARHNNQLLILTAGGRVKQHIFEHVSVLLHYTMPLLRTKFWFSLSIFKKDWPWLNRSRRSFKMIDCDQIALGDLLKRLIVSQWIPSIFKNDPLWANRSPWSLKKIVCVSVWVYYEQGWDQMIISFLIDSIFFMIESIFRSQKMIDSIAKTDDHLIPTLIIVHSNTHTHSHTTLTYNSNTQHSHTTLTHNTHTHTQHS